MNGKVTGTTLLCGLVVKDVLCTNPSVCGLRSPDGFVVNVCREHFKTLKGRKFGSDPEDIRHYREQAVLL